MRRGSRNEVTLYAPGFCDGGDRGHSGTCVFQNTQGHDRAQDAEYPSPGATCLCAGAQFTRTHVATLARATELTLVPTARPLVTTLPKCRKLQGTTVLWWIVQTRTACGHPVTWVTAGPSFSFVNSEKRILGAGLHRGARSWVRGFGYHRCHLVALRVGQEVPHRAPKTRVTDAQVASRHPRGILCDTRQRPNKTRRALRSVGENLRRLGITSSGEPTS